jgi:predicted DNA-binding protein with PD1-like motif
MDRELTAGGSGGLRESRLRAGYVRKEGRMEYFAAGSVGRVFVLSLSQGDLLLESVRELIARERIQSAAIVSGIGTLDRCTLHMVTTTGYPPVEHFETWSDTPLELASMSGYVASGEAHLHAVVADARGAQGGHVEENCRVLYLAEIVVAELLGPQLRRMPDTKGIRKLQEAHPTGVV